MRRVFSSLPIAIACLCLGSPAAPARLVEDWPYERLFKEADLVVIATVVSTKVASDTFVDEQWPLEFVGQNTTFEVIQALKGKASDKKVVVLHFRFGKVHPKAAAKGDKVIEIIDSPRFVYFRTKPAKVEIDGVELRGHKFEYLLFLKKRADERYELVSGRIDPDLSIRELFGPLFSRHEGDKGKDKEEGAKPLLSLHGRKSKVTQQGYHRVETAAGWKGLWLRHQTGETKPDKIPETLHHAEVDFGRCMVIAVFHGKGINCAGYEVHSIEEKSENLLVRVQGLYFQTGVPATETEAWGFFVIPRSKKPVVVELDTRSLIDAPPKWTRVAELKPGDNSVEK